MAEDIIGLWYFKERSYPRSCNLRATVISETAQLFSLDLHHVDEALDNCEKN